MIARQRKYLHGRESNRPMVLVTGASGFVGRHLVRALADGGYRVRGVTRHSPPERIAGVSQWSQVDSIGPETDWTDALKGVSVVVHLAALAHCTDPRLQPSEEEFLKVNALGTRALAEAALASGSVRKFVYISSIGAVTESSPTVVDETTPPRPLSPYGRSKQLGEQAVRETLTDASIEACTLRPVLVYGRGNPGNMARLLRLVRLGLPLPLDGFKNRRNFVFVGSLVDAIVSVIRTRGIGGQTFNVADNEAVSTSELIRLVAKAAQKPLRLWSAPPWGLGLAASAGDLAGRLGIHTGLDAYSLLKLRSSLEVANDALIRATGWKPRMSLADGLRVTLGSNQKETTKR